MYPFLFLSMYFQILLLVSFFENRKKIKDEEFFEKDIFPSVTIAVPCWNEEKTLASTLDSLLSLDYPKNKLSVIVVDDGSKDKTLAIAREYEKKYSLQVKALTKENGGKHTAVNVALKESTSELFGCLDADSSVDTQALRVIVSYFNNNKKIMAVTPCMHIRNPKTLIQRMQAIEYLMGIFLRKAFGQLDAIQVTPGPFSIFRKSVFNCIGPYHKAHNTEDYEITLRMHKAGLKIANAHKALVYTIGPATVQGYFFQRLRWVRGFLENSLDYREIFFKKEYGNFGMFTLPVAFIFVFYGLYTFLFMTYLFVSRWIDAMVRWSTIGFHPHLPVFDIFYFNTTVIAFASMVMFTMFLLTLYIANTLTDDRQQFYRNFPIYFFFYPVFIPFILMRAVLDTFTHRKNVWVLQDNKKS